MFTCNLPSGKTAAVEAPNYFHRTETVKEFRPIKDEVGYTVEELMAAKSVVAVDGKPVNNKLSFEPIQVLAGWPPADVQYFIEWYMTLFFLEDKLRDRAVNEAKKLMMNGDSNRSPAKV
jgi:hypothetical protein